LQRLCERSFLTLWSYPGVFRDQGKEGHGDGKEICDLLVVFGRHVLIFSDKDIAFPETGNLQTDWRRWYSRAVLAGAKQVWGAERWLRDFPDRIFLDRKCTVSFPYPLPQPPDAVYHLIVVAHGAARRCRELHGGSGSLMLMPARDDDGLPFALRDLDAQRSFVHVLDDTSLEVIMHECDTITDYVNYRSKKESIIRSGGLISTAGEDELLAFYLKDLNRDKEHDFILPADTDGVAIGEGNYAGYLRNPQHLRKVRANRISYAWDRLIEKFSGNVLGGTLYEPADTSVRYHEQGLRLLAREPRVRRRMLSEAFIGIIEGARAKGPNRYVRVMEPSGPGDPYYVFLVLEPPAEMAYEQYRAIRRQLLLDYCRVVRLQYPSAATVVGLATEPSGARSGSEDLIVYDGSQFSDSEREEAEEVQANLGLLRGVQRFATVTKEYPDASEPAPRVGGRFPGTGRNDRCPCRSGKKYKKCCGP
jgi:hypothetical protein